VHLCPLGLVDVSIPIRSVGEDLGYLVTAQAQSDNPDISASWQGAFAPGDQEFAAFAGKLSRRSHLELENAAACLSAVAWLTGTLAAARRRNSSLATHIREQRRWLQQHVTTDPVTGVANRRRFCAALEAEVLRARRYKRSLAVAVLDIEGFRGINDEFGHGTGDAVLRSVADCLSSTIRQTDLVGRVGGDEFGVLFPETTRSEAMIALARVGNGIIDLNASGELPVEVRVSVGAVDITQETDDMLGAAIKAEEQARSLGGYVG
jgi:diguanylate cyclase (GGDEF)-like protein